MILKRTGIIKVNSSCIKFLWKRVTLLIYDHQLHTKVKIISDYLLPPQERSGNLPKSNRMLTGITMVFAGTTIHLEFCCKFF